MALKRKQAVTGPATEQNKADATMSEYKGNPLLTLPILGRESTQGKPFTFGVAKARTILMYLEEIREFIDECDKSGD